jgi:hypothetical protein
MVSGWENMTDEEIRTAIVNKTRRPGPAEPILTSDKGGRKLTPRPREPPPAVRPVVRPVVRPPKGRKETGYKLMWKSARWFFLKRYIVKIDHKSYAATPAGVAATLCVVYYAVRKLLGAI